ncbi:heparan-alpha-glucosaminide N-acetyltransferase [Ruminococcus sp.]|uniref:heparan-alpha-glucosaminide N-acetyltransferase n=1 Tax=Ruminococcus sp. TaxID=41978 RepID=UPI0038903B69
MNEKRRYGVIDAIRAVAILNMIAFHLCYDIFVVFGVWEGFYLATPVVIWERMICSTFILISGVSLHFSRRGWKRGVLVFLCGMAVTLVMALVMPEQAIWFGILHFLGLAMILGSLLKPALDRLSPLWGMLVFFLLFMLSYGIPDGYLGLFSHPLVTLPRALYQVPWLAFVGLPAAGFSSSDYFPLLPWIFLYLFGVMLWRFLLQRQLDRFFVRRIPVLGFIGKHSLLIYMVHQPILYGICYLIFLFLP